MADDRMTQRLAPKDQTLQEAYDVPANFLEIDVCSPETHGIANKRYTDYEVRLKVGFVVTCNILKKMLSLAVLLGFF